MNSKRSGRRSSRSVHRSNQYHRGKELRRVITLIRGITLLGLIWIVLWAIGMVPAMKHTEGAKLLGTLWFVALVIATFSYVWPGQNLAEDTEQPQLRRLRGSDLGQYHAQMEALDERIAEHWRQ